MPAAEPQLAHQSANLLELSMHIPAQHTANKFRGSKQQAAEPFWPAPTEPTTVCAAVPGMLCIILCAAYERDERYVRKWTSEGRPLATERGGLAYVIEHHVERGAPSAITHTPTCRKAGSMRPEAARSAIFLSRSSMLFTCTAQYGT